jgi:hypothetical protein
MRFFYLITILVFLQSCGTERRNEFIYVYSKDKSNVITIISDYSKNERIIAVGKHSSKPERDYYLVDISKVTHLGDELGVCWGPDGNNWEIANHKAEILEANIDTTRYVFRGYWFQDKHGIPNTLYYIEDNCFTFETLNYTEHYPIENGSVERLD